MQVAAKLTCDSQRCCQLPNDFDRRCSLQQWRRG